MLTFSTDPKVAERQMQAIIFYLTTFGYIDGDFDSAEKDFVREYIRKLVEVRVTSGMPQADETLRLELVGKFTQHFHEVFEGIDRHVRELFTEAVAKDEDQDAFIHSKLKLRCFELFQEFDDANQKVLIEAMDDLIAADGELHPAELKFRNELIDLFESDIDIDIAVTDADKKVHIADAPIDMRASQVTHPFFDQFEHHYSADPETIKQQIQGDRQLIDTMIALLATQADVPFVAASFEPAAVGFLDPNLAGGGLHAGIAAQHPGDDFVGRQFRGRRGGQGVTEADQQEQGQGFALQFHRWPDAMTGVIQ